MLQCCHTQFAACCNLSIPMGYGWAANTTELILQTFSSVNVAVWVPFTRWTEENHRKPINPYLFRTFWMWTHFVLVPSLQSLLVRLQSHPMVQQCTQGAPTTNSWRTRNLKRCSALCGRRPSLTLSRGIPPSKPSRPCPPFPRPCPPFPRPCAPNAQIAAEAHGQTIFGRKLGTDRSNSCELGRVEEGDLCSRSGQHRSWYSPCNFETSSWGLGVTFPDYPGFVLACHSKFWQENAFGVSRSDGYFICQTGTENLKSILAQLQPCQWPGFKHICSCDASKHAKYRESNLNPLVLTSTSTDLVNARWTGPMQMCLTLVTCCITLLLQLMTIRQGHGNTLESYGYRGGPMGTAVEICWNGNMLSDTTDGGSLTGKATRRLAIWLLGNFCEEWRVVLEASLTHSRSVASARSTDPVGSHSADSCTRIHCRECCAGATCQPAHINSIQ